MELIHGVLEQGKFSHLVLADTWKTYPGIDKTKRAFITRLTEGTIEKKITIDYVISKYSKTKIDKLKPYIRTILRMGIYQILFMEVPDSAACNESVKLAIKKGYSGLKGFVNGLLRTVVREKDSIEYPKGMLGLSIQSSMPLWIVEHFCTSYGEEKAREILKAFEHQGSDLCVRFHTTFASKDIICSMLEEDGVVVKAHPLGHDAYLLSNVSSITSLQAFKKGYIQIQDFSAMMAVELGKEYLKPGMNVIDVCAAPGGKSLQAADYMHNEGCIISRDVSETKTRLIRENCLRSGFECIKEEVWDATKLDETKREWADFVIADLPCSGLGIVAKKPDIKYNVSVQSLKDLALLQREILSVVQLYPKQNGYLLYSTCTMNPAENEENSRWFEATFPYRCIAEKQFFPQNGLCDGFYAALFQKYQ